MGYFFLISFLIQGHRISRETCRKRREDEEDLDDDAEEENHDDIYDEGDDEPYSSCPWCLCDWWKRSARSWAQTASLVFWVAPPDHKVVGKRWVSSNIPVWLTKLAVGVLLFLLLPLYTSKLAGGYLSRVSVVSQFSSIYDVINDNATICVVSKAQKSIILTTWQPSGLLPSNIIVTPTVWQSANNGVCDVVIAPALSYTFGLGSTTGNTACGWVVQGTAVAKSALGILSSSAVVSPYVAKTIQFWVRKQTQAGVWSQIMSTYQPGNLCPVVKAVSPSLDVIDLLFPLTLSSGVLALAIIWRVLQLTVTHTKKVVVEAVEKRAEKSRFIRSMRMTRISGRESRVSKFRGASALQLGVRQSNLSVLPTAGTSVVGKPGAVGARVVFVGPKDNETTGPNTQSTEPVEPARRNSTARRDSTSRRHSERRGSDLGLFVPGT